MLKIVCITIKMKTVGSASTVTSGVGYRLLSGHRRQVVVSWSLAVVQIT